MWPTRSFSPLALLVLAAPFLMGQAPAISSGGVVGAGLSSPVIHSISPNGIISIFGQNFAPASTVRAVTGSDLVNGALPTNLGGVCVKVGSDFARMLLVTSNQINAQVPALSGSGAISVQVLTSCGTNPVSSAPEPVVLQAAAPEFFTFLHGDDGRSPVAATDAIGGGAIGGLSVADQIPGGNFQSALPGKIVTLYATGLGLTNPPLGSGVLATTAAPLAGAVSVALNGVALPSANVLYAGVAVGFAGLYQINLTIPNDAPTGDLGITITVGGVSSPLGTYISIQRVPGTGIGNQAYVASVSVTSTQSWLLSARTLQLQARAYDPAGSPVSKFAPTWQSTNPAVAAVDANGLVRGLAPGSTEIRAIASDGIIGHLTMHVYPSQVKIQPDPVSLQVSQQMTFTASALDADGKAISGTGFRWYSSVPAIATVNAQGVVTALQPGIVTLSVSLTASDPSYNFGAETSVTVMPKPAYRLTQLLSTETQSSGVRIKAFGEVSYAGNDVMAFVARLSNGSEAVMLYKDGQLKPTAFAGQYLPALGRVMEGFNSASVNSSGDVAVLAKIAQEWGGDQAILLFRQGQTPILIQRGCCFNMPVRALTDDGTLMYTWGNDVYTRSPSGVLSKAFGSATTIPGYPSFSQPWTARMYTSGHVYFVSGSGHFYWDGKAVQKILATGDNAAGRSVQWTDQPIEGDPGVYYTRLGDGIVTSIMKFSGGTATALVTSGQTVGTIKINWIHRVLDVRNGVLAFLADTDSGQAAVRLTLASSSTEVSSSFTDYTVLDRTFTQGFASTAGGILAVTATGLDGASRWSGRLSTPVVGPNSSISGTVPNGFNSYYIPKGINSANPVFRGEIDSLFNLRSGAIQPVLTPGDTLPGGKRHVYIEAFGAARNGDYAFVSYTDGGPSLFQVVNGGVSRLAAVGDSLAGRNVNWLPGGNGEPAAINNRGQVAARLQYATGDEINLFTNGVPQTVLAWPSVTPGGGGSISGNLTYAIDEGGRMLIGVNTSSGWALLFWNAGKLTTVLRQGDKDSRGKAVNELQAVLAGGSKFFVKLAYSGEGHSILSFDGIGFTVLAQSNSTVAGKYLNDAFGSNFAVNTAGDIAYLATFQDGSGIVMRKSNGSETLVAHSSVQTSNGAWFLHFYSLGITEQGDVFFTATTATHATDPDRTELFQASPQ